MNIRALIIMFIIVTPGALYTKALIDPIALGAHAAVNVTKKHESLPKIVSDFFDPNNMNKMSHFLGRLQEIGHKGLASTLQRLVAIKSQIQQAVMLTKLRKQHPEVSKLIQQQVCSLGPSQVTAILSKRI